jgi:hypothetical protein
MIGCYGPGKIELAEICAAAVLARCRWPVPFCAGMGWTLTSAWAGNPQIDTIVGVLWEPRDAIPPATRLFSGPTRCAFAAVRGVTLRAVGRLRIRGRVFAVKTFLLSWSRGWEVT